MSSKAGNWARSVRFFRFSETSSYIFLKASRRFLNKYTLLQRPEKLPAGFPFPVFPGQYMPVWQPGFPGQAVVQGRFPSNREKEPTYIAVFSAHGTEKRQRNLPLPLKCRKGKGPGSQLPAAMVWARSQMRAAAAPSSSSCWRRTIPAQVSGSASRAAARAATSPASLHTTLMPWAEK